MEGLLRLDADYEGDSMSNEDAGKMVEVAYLRDVQRARDLCSDLPVVKATENQGYAESTTDNEAQRIIQTAFSTYPSCIFPMYRARP